MNKKYLKIFKVFFFKKGLLKIWIKKMIKSHHTLIEKLLETERMDIFYQKKKKQVITILKSDE